MTTRSDAAVGAARRAVTVFGAAGHTGRFVVAELQRRGFHAILAGRDREKLRVLGDQYPDFEVRVASVDDRASLDRAVAGADAVVNCAGPFADTAAPVIEAALAAKIHYLDVTAEQVVALSVFEQFADRAASAGIVVVPALGFYGGLSDLLATVAMADWASADELSVAIALDSWKPTRGTRLTGQLHAGRRFVFTGGGWQPPPDPPVTRQWAFPEPVGVQDVIALSMIDAAILSRHLRVPEIPVYMNLAPLTELRDPATPLPSAVDEQGRSAQQFMVEVVARRGSAQRRACARGRDIYAITAPILVEAISHILAGRARKTGVVTVGEALDAAAMLAALSPGSLVFARQ